MKIAVIGWGSLIWNIGTGKRRLHLLGGGKWKRNGPLLPVEYARISSGDRLTLVLLDGAKDQPTYWAVHQSNDLGHAENNLMIREGSSKPRIIRSVTLDEKTEDPITTQIQHWLKTTDCQAAIWTSLDSNFKEEIGPPFSTDNAIEYLKTLVRNNSETCAKDYIAKTPLQIDTDVRKQAVSKLGWLNCTEEFFLPFLE